jgi:signal transduction histidine kinase
MSGLVVLYAGHRYRVRRLLEIERVRTRIATDLHDDLGASLSRMAILSEVVKRQIREQDQQSVSLLNEIADSARNLVGSLRDIVWAIDARSATLSDVIVRLRQFASDVLDPKGIAWKLEASSRTRDLRVDPESRRHVLLFFKEAVHDVVRHAECTSVQLSIDSGDHQLVCEVRDDGRGFDAAAAGGTPESFGGRGLRNMRARAAQLGGDLEVGSVAGGGTRLRMVVPARARRA